MASSKNSKIAIVNGNLFINKRFIKGSILIKNNKIKKVVFDELSDEKLKKYSVIDARDSYVSYGFIDPHVHFRIPGQEYKEDWKSGSKAAIKGGYTFVIDMPNNNPSAVTLKSLIHKNKLAHKSPINYGFFIGLTDKNAKEMKAVFKKLKIKKMPIYGIKAFLGSSTGSLLVSKKKTLSESLATSIINLYHCEDEAVLKEHDGKKYKSIYSHNNRRPPAAEVSGIKKIISASKKIKKQAKIYICHVTSKDQVEVIKKYREEGYNIIAEVTPHHLFFNLSDIEDSSIYKVNPPIREFSDADTLRKEFNKCFFQVIGSDHAPHLKKEKDSDNPPSGFPGLETAFYALYHLHKDRILSLEVIFRLLTSAYKIFGIKKRGKLKAGNFADITIIKKEPNIVSVNDTCTKADFTPFEGLSTDCKIDTVIINGKVCLKNSVFV